VVLALKRLYILRVQDRESSVKIDICVNNMLGLVNSEYIKRYIQLDSRYLSLCRLMKHLHETHRPYGDQESLKMTNYAMNMMILVYLI
jgi:DNA polymerase sigma